MSNCVDFDLQEMPDAVKPIPAKNGKAASSDSDEDSDDDSDEEVCSLIFLAITSFVFEYVHNFQNILVLSHSLNV